MFDEVTEEYKRLAAEENDGNLPGQRLDSDEHLEIAINALLKEDTQPWPKPLANRYVST